LSPGFPFVALAIYIFLLKLISYGNGFSFPRAFARSIGDFSPAHFGVREPGAGFSCSIGYPSLRSDLRDILIGDGGPFIGFRFQGLFIPAFSVASPLLHLLNWARRIAFHPARSSSSTIRFGSGGIRPPHQGDQITANGRDIFLICQFSNFAFMIW